MSWIAENIWNVYWAIIVFFSGFLLDKILERIPLSERIGYRIELFFLKIYKWIKNTEVDIKYVIKTDEFLDETLNFNIIEEFDVIKQYKFEGENVGWLTYLKNDLKIRPSIKFKPVNLPKDFMVLDGEYYLNSIEIEITAQNIKYRDFSEDLVDLMNIKTELEKEFLKREMGELKSDSLTCKIENVSRFTGLLSEFDIAGLDGTLHGSRIEFGEKKLTIYGVISSDVIKLLKKIIAFYY